MNLQWVRGGPLVLRRAHCREVPRALQRSATQRSPVVKLPACWRLLCSARPFGKRLWPCSRLRSRGTSWHAPPKQSERGYSCKPLVPCCLAACPTYLPGLAARLHGPPALPPAGCHGSGNGEGVLTVWLTACPPGCPAVCQTSWLAGRWPSGCENSLPRRRPIAFARRRGGRCLYLRPPLPSPPVTLSRAVFLVSPSPPPLALSRPAYRCAAPAAPFHLLPPWSSHPSRSVSQEAHPGKQPVGLPAGQSISQPVCQPVCQAVRQACQLQARQSAQQPTDPGSLCALGRGLRRCPLQTQAAGTRWDQS